MTKKHDLDPFYPIFDDVTWLERLVPLGIKLVQLRIKDQDEPSIIRQVRLAKKICAQHDCTLILNDYWRIAIDEGLDFIHLGQEDLDDADIKAIQNAQINLGISTHDKAELERALKLDPHHIALGPIYPTILKKMKWHQQGVEKLATWRNKIGDLPLIAIGGMTLDRADLALEQGADCVACVTNITLADNPEAVVKSWLKWRDGIKNGG